MLRLGLVCRQRAAERLSNSAHGFGASSLDFGIVWDMGTAAMLETRTYKTVTHMVPSFEHCNETWSYWAAGNVLLNSSADSAHGFEAKIADFGMARDLGAAAMLKTCSYGTITHMAPEVLAEERVSRVCQILDLRRHSLDC